MRSAASVFLLLLLVTASCKPLKLVGVLKKGEVRETDFYVSVPFEYRMDLAVIQVVIKGKTYHFMVDTGAPNAISKELAAEIGTKTVVSRKTVDSGGESSELDFVTLDTVTIGGLHFLNTGAVVADLTQSSAIACLKIDGLIGANLMRKAIWEFDYKKQIISIASGREKLEIPSDAAVLAFKPVLSGTPKVTIEYNGHKETGVTFDTGSNGSFTSSDNMFKMLSKDTSELKTIYGYGSNSAGLYGASAGDTTRYALVDVKIGELTVPMRLVSFRSSGSNLVGTDFFRNYRMILDWFTEEALLIKEEEIKPDELSTYGFTPIRSGDKLLVGFVYHNSRAEELGIKTGDCIVRINDTVYTFLTDDQWCELISEGMSLKGTESVKVEIVREEAIIAFDLGKTVILEE